MSRFPTFPSFGEPWIDCSACGFSLPRSQAVTHYKTGKLVCLLDADELTHDDYMAFLEQGDERDEPSEQKVSNQGQAFFGDDEPGGAGGGGAGGGGAGG